MTEQEKFERRLAEDPALRAEIPAPCDCDKLTEEDEALLDAIEAKLQPAQA